MERYRDFREVLKKLVDKRLRICFYLDTMDGSGKYEAFGRIKELNDHCLTMECEPEAGTVPSNRTHLNLGAIVIYAIDEIPEDADLTKLEGEK